MGYLPGKIEEKMEPYFRPIKELLFKLHEVRSANRLFVDPEAEKLVFDEKRIEMLPINFLRGANIDDAFVIIDEIQNLPRNEVRTVLSRMGENVKCICTGDVKQVDNPHLTSENNGMN
jgi:PhoH-like ATPase